MNPTPRQVLRVMATRDYWVFVAKTSLPWIVVGFTMSLLARYLW